MNPQQSTDVIARHEGDKMLVFHQKTGWICIMNPTSSFIWESCTGDNSPSEIAELVQQHFDFSESPWTTDGLRQVIAQHLDLLQKGKLLQSPPEQP